MEQVPYSPSFHVSKLFSRAKKYRTSKIHSNSVKNLVKSWLISHVTNNLNRSTLSYDPREEHECLGR